MSAGNFDFRLPDGRVIRIEGAPSQEAALAQMDTMWPTLRLETPIEGFGESFGQQFRGQVGSVPGAAQAAAAAVGAPETAAFFGRGRTYAAPGDQEPATRAPEPGDFLRDPINALKAYAGQAAGSVLGGAATMGATALIGAGIGGAVGGVPGHLERLGFHHAQSCPNQSSGGCGLGLDRKRDRAGLAIMCAHCVYLSWLWLILETLKFVAHRGR